MVAKQRCSAFGASPGDLYKEGGTSRTQSKPCATGFIHVSAVSRLACFWLRQTLLLTSLVAMLIQSFL